ncbi:Sulfur acceptor protein CsdE [Vibrio stylophorae]|uniref:Sulfur acceptor protein CsdE n=1 Tax=Vibrio stylophorae TaxID=659351 RepID=A0ABN8DT81_9VIBR|nr:cysteine desulfurase sulfur acceptor subunit CsdE [Vibrio stylophorae]CAH0534261.1 Sulfur acceptor protein CsdE [Vibrio stylophorae]
MFDAYHQLTTEYDSDAVITLFTPLKQWEDKYRQVIQLGKKLPVLDASLKSQALSLAGCESQVWCLHEIKEGQLLFALDSDARIVRGLIVLILAAVNGKPPAEIAALDLEAYFAQLNLLEQLSASRSSGVRAIINHLQQLAADELAK